MAKKSTITYSWDIPQMNAHIEQFGENNVIYTVHYRYTGVSSEKMPGTDNYYGKIHQLPLRLNNKILLYLFFIT